MKTEVISKLLNSPIKEDVLLGLNYAQNVGVEYFKSSMHKFKDQDDVRNAWSKEIKCEADPWVYVQITGGTLYWANKKIYLTETIVDEKVEYRGYKKLIL